MNGLFYGLDDRAMKALTLRNARLLRELTAKPLKLKNYELGYILAQLKDDGRFENWSVVYIVRVACEKFNRKQGSLLRTMYPDGWGKLNDGRKKELIKLKEQVYDLMKQ